MTPKYEFSFEDIINKFIPEPNKQECLKLYLDNKELFDKSPGSSHNHQAWPGGYIGHIRETMGIAHELYFGLKTIRELPFKLEQAWLVLYLHDLEKPFIYGGVVKFESKQARREFRENKIQEYGILLTPEEANALRYVEGELDDYSSKKRVMNELAAFCHMCDVASARIWHDYPEH